MKIKRAFIPLTIIILLSIILYFNYQNYKLGSRAEREELLVAVMFDLTNNRAVANREDIKKLEVFRSHESVYPYFYRISVTLKNGDQLTYQWANKAKTNLNIFVYPSPYE